VAGPAVIAGSVLIVLHAVAFSGRVSTQNADLLSLWLPTHCFLGTSLRAGHIPAWNPYAMGGVPFAADPQSGWMNLPAMLLYSVLPCGAALNAFVVLQPILAGLGVYWFCRGEGASRVAATFGGVALGVGLAGSSVVLALPFSAAFAWTALTLAAASRLLRARTWAARLAWLGLTALAWGQLAAAHPSTGFVLGSLAIVAYLVARIVSDREHRGTAALLAALLLLAVPLVNLAWLLPRLEYLPRTNIALGYDRMEALARAYSHGLPAVSPLPGRAVRPTEPLRHVASPGEYLGAVALALSFAGWRTKHRAVVIGFAVFGVLCYVLSLQAVAEWGAAHFRHVRLLGVWLREPARFALGIPIAVAVLGAFGVEGWRAARSWRDRAALVAPAVAVWLCLPLAFGADFGNLGLFAAGVLAAAVLLVAVSFRPWFVWALPVLLASELVANGLATQAHQLSDTPANQRALRPLYQLADLDVRTGDVLRPGAIALALQRTNGDARFVSIDPGGWDPRGLHVHQAARSWPLLAMNQSMILGVPSAQGYDATQERRYWTFLRKVDPRVIKYNAADLEHPASLALNALDVGWIVAPAADPPSGAARPVVREGSWALYRIAAPPLASLNEGATMGQPVSSARLGPQRLRMVTGPTTGGLLVIRDVFDPNWHATVDGHPAPVVPVDGLVQGVRLGPGRHTVVLAYDDPSIGEGLLASLLVLLGLFGTSLVLWLRGRSRRVGQSAPHANGDPDRDEAP